MPQPAAELRAAADKLRALAAAATQLPWRKHDAEYPHLVIQAPADAPASECAGMVSTNLTPNEDADAAYIAAMQPGVGAALADWLDGEAKKHAASIAAAASVWGSTGHPDAIAWLDTGAGRVSPHALAVARALNSVV